MYFEVRVQRLDRISLVFGDRFSPHGKLLASGSWDSTVKLYNVATKQVIATLEGHSDGVNSIAFSSNGRVLASGSDDAIKLWNVETKQEISTEGIQPVPGFATVENVVPDFSGGAESLVFSPHGMVLASSYHGGVRLWNTANRKTIGGSFGNPPVKYKIPSSLAFNSDGKLLAIGNEGYVDWALNLNPEGERIVYGDRKVRIDNVATKVGQSLTGHSGDVYSVAFSPDGTTLASGSWDSTIKLWNVETKQEIFTFKGHFDNVVYSVAFSPDGTTLASGSWNSIKLWNVETKRETATLPSHSGAVYSVAFSPDGKLLASSSYDGSHDNTIQLWDVETQQETATLPGHSDIVYSVTFSPDGKLLASGSGDNTIKLWNVETKQEIDTLEGHSDSVCSVAFSPDGKLLASGSNDNTIKLWDVETKQVISEFTATFYDNCSLAFSPDGKFLADSDQTIQLWNVKTKQKIGSIDPNEGHYGGMIYSIAFSADGKTLASGSQDATIILWDVETKTENTDFK